MSSKSALVCNRRAWETIHMAKLIMITLCNTTACTSYCEGKGRGQPGWHCGGPPGWPPQDGRTCWPPAVAHVWAAQSWGEPPRAEGSCPELKGAARAEGEPPRSWEEPPAPSGPAGQLCRDTSPLQASENVNRGLHRDCDQSPALFPSFHSAPYPPWHDLQVTPHYTSYKLIFDSEFAAQGSAPRPWLHLHYLVQSLG